MILNEEDLDEVERRQDRIVRVADLLARDVDVDRRAARALFAGKGVRATTRRRIRRAIQRLGLTEFVRLHAPHVLTDAGGDPSAVPGSVGEVTA